MRPDAKLRLARLLRGRMTEAEQHLWLRLRRQQLGVRFRRQHPVGPYIADFACIQPPLIIEIDGSQHLDSASDRQRDAKIATLGFRVRRYWNHDVLTRTDDVVEDILRAIDDARNNA